MDLPAPTRAAGLQWGNGLISHVAIPYICLASCRGHGSEVLFFWLKQNVSSINPRFGIVPFLEFDIM